MNDLRARRLQLMLSREELSAIDDFRLIHRIPTRAATIRELLKRGLVARAASAVPGVKSSDYGVFSCGPTGHLADTDE
jgi:hypothetical protein